MLAIATGCHHGSSGTSASADTIAASSPREGTVSDEEYGKENETTSYYNATALPAPASWKAGERATDMSDDSA